VNHVSAICRLINAHESCKFLSLIVSFRDQMYTNKNLCCVWSCELFVTRDDSDEEDTEDVRPTLPCSVVDSLLH